MIFDDKGGSWESSAKFVDEKPGDEEFPGVGSYKIKTTFELYGEINVTCNIDVNARSCVGSMYILLYFAALRRIDKLSNLLFIKLSNCQIEIHFSNASNTSSLPGIISICNCNGFLIMLRSPSMVRMSYDYIVSNT